MAKEGGGGRYCRHGYTDLPALRDKQRRQEMGAQSRGHPALPLPRLSAQLHPRPEGARARRGRPRAGGAALPRRDEPARHRATPGRRASDRSPTGSRRMRPPYRPIPPTIRRRDGEGDGTVEVDELATFIGGKKPPISVTVAVARDTRLIVGQRVMWAVDLAAMQPFADALPAVGRYCTDGAAVYPEVIWPEDAWHAVSIAKEETYTIEGINADSADVSGAIEAAQPLFQPERGEAGGGGAAVRLALQPQATADQCQPRVPQHPPAPLLATPGADGGGIVARSVDGGSRARPCGADALTGHTTRARLDGDWRGTEIGTFHRRAEKGRRAVPSPFPPSLSPSGSRGGI